MSIIASMSARSDPQAAGPLGRESISRAYCAVWRMARIMATWNSPIRVDRPARRGTAAAAVAAAPAAGHLPAADVPGHDPVPIPALLGTPQRWQVIRRTGAFAWQPDAGTRL